MTSHLVKWQSAKSHKCTTNSKSYFLKARVRRVQTPQTILNFPQKDCLRTRKVSRLHCLHSYWRAFLLFLFSHCNKLSIKTQKHTIFSTKMLHWHQILVIFMILHFCRKILSSRFTQFFRRILETDSVDWVAFRMSEYVCTTYGIFIIMHSFLMSWKIFTPKSKLAGFTSDYSEVLIRVNPWAKLQKAQPCKMPDLLWLFLIGTFIS